MTTDTREKALSEELAGEIRIAHEKVRRTMTPAEYLSRQAEIGYLFGNVQYMIAELNTIFRHRIKLGDIPDYERYIAS